MPTPKNQIGQSPTHTPKETAKRLEEKAKDQRGGSNKRKTQAKARSAR